MLLLVPCVCLLTFLVASTFQDVLGLPNGAETHSLALLPRDADYLPASERALWCLAASHEPSTLP